MREGEKCSKDYKAPQNKTINAGMPHGKFEKIYKNIEKQKCYEKIFFKL